MVSRLIGLVIILASAALGVGAAALLVDGFRVQPGGFILSIVVLTVAQALLAPLVAKLVGRHVPALEGGVGVLSTLLALLVASLIPRGITLGSVSTWVLATLVIWVVTGIASAVLAAWNRRREERAAAGPGTSSGANVTR